MRGSDVADYYRNQASTLSDIIDKHKAVAHDILERYKVLQAQLVAAQQELAAVYLPALTDRDLERVAKLTGFQGFSRRDPRLAIEQERKVLAASIAKMEADERFVNRDLLVSPDGTLSQQLAEMRETFTIAQEACEKFEKLDGFLELVEIGYDTPKFDEKWWHATYWKHWAAGDRICKALDMNDFGDDVLPAYLKVAEPRDFLAGEVRRINQQINDVHLLVRERDRLANRLQNLDAIYLEEAQKFLGEHLANADVALLEQWAAAEPDLTRAVQMGVRKLAGISAKRMILGDMANIGLPEMVNKLDERRRKAQQKASKFSRPKHAYANFPDNSIDRTASTKLSGVKQQVEKLEQRVDKLMAADRYDGFDLRNDQQLWWLYFMNSQPPRYAPSLYSYYEQHPNITVMTDDSVELPDDSGEAAARAFIAGDQEQGGYLS